MFPTSFLRKFLVVVAAAAVLAACGSSKTNKGGNFSTKGLRPPVASCKVKPSRLGLAEKIRDIDITHSIAISHKKGFINQILGF